MARKLHIAALGVAIVTAILVTALGGAYFASQRVQPFYKQALAIDPQVLETGRREFEGRATALYSDARQQGRWRAVFTADEINGWLALRLVDVYGDRLPNEIAEPRVAIKGEVLRLGFRSRRGRVDTIISADASVLITDSGAVAVRLKSARAGALPLPAMPVAADIAEACRELSLPVRWTQDAGQPVALVDLHQIADEQGRRITLDTIDLVDGSLYIAGRTEDVAAEESVTRNEKESTVNRRFSPER